MLMQINLRNRMLAKSTEQNMQSDFMCNQVLKSDKISTILLSDTCGDKTMMKSEEFIIIEVSIAITTTRQKIVCDLGEMGKWG